MGQGRKLVVVVRNISEDKRKISNVNDIVCKFLFKITPLNIVIV